MKKYLLFINQLLLALLFANSSNAQITFTSLTTLTTSSLKGISFADTSLGYACGSGGKILKTINGGTTWTTLTSGTIDDLWDIKVVPNSGGQKVMVVGANNTVRKSTNGGTSWTAQSIPFSSGSFVFGVQCLDSVNYFACGGNFGTFSGAVLKTTNGGATWTSTTVSGSFFLDKVFMLNATTGFSVGTVSGTDGRIHKTTNGTTYTNVKSSSDIITNLWCNSATNIIAVGLAGQILKSTNGGATWVNHNFNTTDLYGIQFTDSLNGFACGGTPAGNIILQTTDGGNTWTQLNFAFNGDLQSICIIGNKIFISGATGKIIKATLPFVSGINDFANNNSISVYPNPASSEINISAQNQVTPMEFTLFDAIGRKVKTSWITEIFSTITISDLQNGLYCYEIKNSLEVIKKGKLMIK